MILNYWTMKQAEQLRKDSEKYRIPEDIQLAVIKTLKFLDCNYGTNRDMNDDGGYVSILVFDLESEKNKEYEKILQRYKVTKDCAEFKDVVCNYEGETWCSDLYIVGSEYGVTVIYPIR